MIYQILRVRSKGFLDIRTNSPEYSIILALRTKNKFIIKLTRIRKEYILNDNKLDLNIASVILTKIE